MGLGELVLRGRLSTRARGIGDVRSLCCDCTCRGGGAERR